MIKINLSSTSARSEIYCGEGAFRSIAPEFANKQLFIITDSNVWRIYSGLIKSTLGEDTKVYVLPAGERSKNYKSLFKILSYMLKSGFIRGGTVVAFGGGVVGDIGGLAASLYMRGTRLIQIPTTLLAQVDSSVGGKTAVDMGKIKNAVGTFYQPETVIADSMFLSTLSAKDIKCGLGEIIKYGALNGEIFNKLIQNRNNLERLEFLEEIIADCIKHKAAVVERDERDVSGLRKSLNLGHTTGHAFELFYGNKSHGEYVLEGMFYELYIAEKEGICINTEYSKNLKQLMRSVVKVESYKNIIRAAANAKFDKKNSGNGISVIVPRDIGEWAEMVLSYERYEELLEECSNKLGAGKI